MLWVILRGSLGRILILGLLFFTEWLPAYVQSSEHVVSAPKKEKTVSHDTIINLGEDCQVAFQLTKHGLRNYALPFDALITSYEALYAILANKFEGFMAPDNFVFQVNEKNEKYILDKKYGIKLIHDFKLNEHFLSDYEEIASKYERRIARLFEQISAAEYPLFIRKRITKEQAIELRTLLHTMRNGKPFLLVVLNDNKDGASLEHWNFESVCNFHLKQPDPYFWEGDTQAWKEIFIALGLSVAEKETEKVVADSIQSAA